MQKSNPEYFGKESFFKNKIKLNVEDFIKGIAFNEFVDDPIMRQISDAYSTLASVQNIVLKLRSGAAVSEQEFARLKAEVPMPWDEVNQFRGKMSGFMRRLKKQFEAKNRSLSQRQAPLRDVPDFFTDDSPDTSIEIIDFEDLPD